jgi:hypothetical protein
MTYQPTDDDVQRGAEAYERVARAVLAAVLPAHDKALRLAWERDEACGGLPLVEHDRALILALADDIEREGPWCSGSHGVTCQTYVIVVDLLRRRAEQIGADDE